MDDDDDGNTMMRLGETLHENTMAINRTYRGHARKARLLINELTYGLALIEGNLGVEAVRENWRKYIDRLALHGRAPDTLAREHLLRAFDQAESFYENRHLAKQVKAPRRTERTSLFTDAHGKECIVDMAWPSLEEAAENGIAFLATFDPELAERIPPAEFLKVLRVWLGRGENTGRRGKQEQIDEALSEFVSCLGFPSITAGAMRRQRLVWERAWPLRRRRSRTRKQPARSGRHVGQSLEATPRP